MSEQIISLVKQIKDLKEQLDKLFIGDGSKGFISYTIMKLLEQDEKFSVSIYSPNEGLGGYCLSVTLTSNNTLSEVELEIFVCRTCLIVIKYDNVDIGSYVIHEQDIKNKPHTFTLVPLTDWTNDRGHTYR